jgi:hypothetical protein
MLGSWHQATAVSAVAAAWQTAGVACSVDIALHAFSTACITDKLQQTAVSRS